MDIEEVRSTLQAKIDEINSAPSLDELIQSGEIVKHSRGYEVRSERAMKALSPHIKSIIQPHDTNKPTLITLYRKTINKCSIKFK